MRFITILLILLSGQKGFLSYGQTVLEEFIGPYRLIRGILNQLQEASLQEPFSTNPRIQKPTRNSLPFPCSIENGRSQKKPTTVHALKPGDIDVIGAIGDSMLAGFGVTARRLLPFLSNTRGMSFPIGGDFTWREVTTLPNILKEFNPKLIGYSTGVSMSVEKQSQFNVADDGAISANIPYMTKQLIKRIMQDTRVNMTTDWKMITLLIGANDFCSEICYYEDMDKYVIQHRNDLLASLRLLKKYLPRTFVNLLVAPDVSNLGKFTNKTLMCEIGQRFSCPCFIGEPMKFKRSKVREVMTKARRLQYDITMEGEFETDDFAVVAQPFLWKTSLPTTPEGETDWTYFGIDCFHFSQKAHSVAAKALWKNLFEPVGRKTDKFELDKILHAPMQCPTDQYPYLFTNKNSKTV